MQVWEVLQWGCVLAAIVLAALTVLRNREAERPGETDATPSDLEPETPGR